MVATLVFLNARVAFGAALGVGENPIGRFRLVAALVVPNFQYFARRRRVGFLTTDQAKAAGAIVAVCDAAFRFQGGSRKGRRNALATM